MTVANYFTFFRLFISPLFLLIYLFHESVGITGVYLPITLLAIMGVAELSDACDGYLARRMNQVTDFGKIVDPMADSISRLTYFFAFTQGIVQLPILLVFVFLYRDSTISTLRTLCALKGFALAARSSGKLKAFFQMVAILTILLLMIPHAMGQISTSFLQSIAFWITSVAALFTIYSAFDYIWSNREKVKKLLV